MLKHSWKTAMVLVAMVSASAFGAFNTYTESFDSDTGAWRDNGDGPNPALWSNDLGPDGQPGVMVGSRTDGPFPAQVGAFGGDLGNPIQRIDNFLGDLNAKYGPLVQFSYWVRDLDGQTGGEPNEVTIHPNPAVLRWYTDPAVLAVGPNGWVQYGTTFDTTWTDAEANAGGWFASDPGVSWATLMQNVRNFFINAPTNGPVGNTEALYLDEVFIGGIPEPATLALLGLGGLMLIRRRH